MSISGFFVLQKPQGETIRAVLPSSVGVAVYVHPELHVYAIDAYRAAKPANHALTSQIPAADLPLDLGTHLSVLSDAYAQARSRQTANGFKRLYVNVAELLSSRLKQPVLAVNCDDDESDFACIAVEGRLVELTARCGDTIYGFQNGVLQSVAAGDEHELHSGASSMFARFTGKSPAQFGFGSWDPPLNFALVAVGA